MMVWRELNRLRLGEGSNEFANPIIEVREFLDYSDGYAAPQLP